MAVSAIAQNTSGPNISSNTAISVPGVSSSMFSSSEG
jgi:hypothetical protein